MGMGWFRKGVDMSCDEEICISPSVTCTVHHKDLLTQLSSCGGPSCVVHGAQVHHDLRNSDLPHLLPRSTTLPPSPRPLHHFLLERIALLDPSWALVVVLPSPPTIPWQSLKVVVLESRRREDEQRSARVERWEERDGRGHEGWCGVVEAFI